MVGSLRIVQWPGAEGHVGWPGDGSIPAQTHFLPVLSFFADLSKFGPATQGNPSKMLLRMPSKRRRNQILDKLHRGTATTSGTRAKRTVKRRQKFRDARR
ncbi:hypothetical protein KM043_000462 [Ampulex compressa]|nr:hypothetical protein KM043_000462 [Ampulex compressa]